MQDPKQHMHDLNSAAGSRDLSFFGLVPSSLLGKPGAPVFACVAAAAGLGLMAGLGGAAMASHARAISPVARAIKGGAAALYPSSTVYAARNPALRNPAGALTPASSSKPSATGKATSDSQMLTLASDPQQKPAAVPHKSRHTHKLWNWRKADKQRKPYVSPNVPVSAPDEPTGLERAQAAAADGPFFLGIEGDVTVASYDVADGRVETYEGSNFKLSNAGSIRWTNYPFDVHYRCDGSGNCTLMRGGASAIAKLTR